MTTQLRLFFITRKCPSSRRSTATFHTKKNTVREGKGDTSDFPSGAVSGYQGLYVTSTPFMPSAPTKSIDNRDADSNIVAGRASTEVQHDYNYPDMPKSNASVSKNEGHTPDSALYHTYHSPDTAETDLTDPEGYLVPVRKTSRGNHGDDHVYNYPDPLVGVAGKKSGRGPITPSLSNVDYIEIDDASLPRNIASSREDPSGTMPVYQTKIHRTAQESSTKI